MAKPAEDFQDLQEHAFHLSLSWKENPSAKKLLDAIVSILAEEYLESAKKIPKSFPNKEVL